MHTSPMHRAVHGNDSVVAMSAKGKVALLPSKRKVSCNEIGSVILKTMSKKGSAKCEVGFGLYYVKNILKTEMIWNCIFVASLSFFFFFFQHSF